MEKTIYEKLTKDLLGCIRVENPDAFKQRLKPEIDHFWTELYYIGERANNPNVCSEFNVIPLTIYTHLFNGLCKWTRDKRSYNYEIESNKVLIDFMFDFDNLEVFLDVPQEIWRVKQMINNVIKPFLRMFKANNKKGYLVFLETYGNINKIVRDMELFASKPSKTIFNRYSELDYQEPTFDIDDEDCFKEFEECD